MRTARSHRIAWPSIRRRAPVLGVKFPEPIVARVDILSGQAALGPESFNVSGATRGLARDLVIMDDFLYGEPIASPVETGTEAAVSLR